MRGGGGGRFVDAVSRGETDRERVGDGRSREGEAIDVAEADVLMYRPFPK